MKFRVSPNWHLIAMLILCGIFFFFAIVGFKHVVFGAEPGLVETVIVWEKNSPKVELWVDMGIYKYKAWDNRPGPMEESTKFILQPHGYGQMEFQEQPDDIRQRR